MRLLYRFDAADFDRVVNDVNSHGAVLAQEDAVVDTNVSWVIPATVKALLVVVLLLQLDEDFLLQCDCVCRNFRLQHNCGFVDRCGLCVQVMAYYRAGYGRSRNAFSAEVVEFAKWV